MALSYSIVNLKGKEEKMYKKMCIYASVALALCFILTTLSSAAEKETAGAKAKKFGQKLFSYPANVTKESVNVVADTGKKSVEVTTKEVTRVGEVVTGDVAKTKELVTEPIQGTAETAVSAVEETAKIPVKAGKD